MQFSKYQVLVSLLSSKRNVSRISSLAVGGEQMLHNSHRSSTVSHFQAFLFSLKVTVVSDTLKVNVTQLKNSFVCLFDLLSIPKWVFTVPFSSGNFMPVHVECDRVEH